MVTKPDKLHVVAGNEMLLGNVILIALSVVTLWLDKIDTLSKESLLIVVGSAEISVVLISPNVATYCISVLLVAMSFPSTSVIVIETLSVGFVLIGLDTSLKSIVASKLGLM